MNPQTTSNRRPLITWLVAPLIGGLLLSSSAYANDFSWNNASQSTWSTAGNWTPSGPPGSGDNVVAATQFGNILINVSPTVANWTYASDTATIQQIIGNVASSSPALTINGTLAKSGTGTLRFRDSSASTTLTVNIGQITATGGVLEFGTAASTTNGLRSLTIGSASISDTKIAFNMLNSSGNLATVTNNLSLSGTAELSIAQVATTTSGILSVGSLSSTDTTTIIQANSFTSTATSIGTLVLNNSTGSTSYAGEIKTSFKVNAGNLMSVTKNGAGTQILTGNNNTYNGATLVNNGALLINNTSGSGTGTSTITVNNGGTFGGTGAATGAVTVNNGGILLGGDGATAGDNLALSGNVTFQDGAIIQLALGATGTHSSLTRSGGTWSFDSDQIFILTDLGAQVGFYDNIITGLAGSESGLTSISSWAIQNPGWTGTFSYDGAGGVDLNITSLSSVPEPSTYALLAGGVATLAVTLRRRRSNG